MKCFGNHAHKVCDFLTVSKCQGKKCVFFKSDSTVRKDRRKAYRMLAALPRAMQEHISEKYYKGKMPWQKK